MKYVHCLKSYTSKNLIEIKSFGFIQILSFKTLGLLTTVHLYIWTVPCFDCNSLWWKEYLPNVYM